jgi:hypothetical protein
LEIPVDPNYIYYRWFKNGAPIISTNKSKYTVISNGAYFVEVTDYNGCLNYSDTVYINLSTNIHNPVAQSDIKIYPNPTQNIIHIESPIKLNVMVFDLVGKVIIDQKNASIINLEDFADNTYLLRISDEEGNYLGSERIMKVTR